jgi:hypothetical protein
VDYPTHKLFKLDDRVVVVFWVSCIIRRVVFLERSWIVIFEGLLPQLQLRGAIGIPVTRSRAFFYLLLERNHHGVLLCFSPLQKVKLIFNKKQRAQRRDLSTKE